MVTSTPWGQPSLMGSLMRERSEFISELTSDATDEFHF
jgi:hypothetical protein